MTLERHLTSLSLSILNCKVRKAISTSQDHSKASFNELMCVICLTQDWAFEQALLSRGRYFPGGAGLLHKPPGAPSNWDYRTAALARGSLDPVERREHFRP